MIATNLLSSKTMAIYIVIVWPIEVMVAARYRNQLIEFSALWMKLCVWEREREAEKTLSFKLWQRLDQNRLQMALLLLF